MKSYLSISIIFSVLSVFASVGTAEKYKTMIMPDYKNVAIMAEEVEKNSLGITRDRIITTTKLRLLRNDLRVKPIDITASNIGYIYVRVTVVNVVIGQKSMGSAISIDVRFQRYHDDMLVTEPLAIQPTLILANNYEYFENTLNEQLDELILTYLESNME